MTVATHSSFLRFVQSTPSCRAVVQMPTVLFVYLWKKQPRLASETNSLVTADRIKSRACKWPVGCYCGTGCSASTHPEVFPGTPWWLRCCRTLRRRQGTGRPWAVREKLLQETQNPSQRLTSCHPCLGSLVFAPRSADKQTSSVTWNYILQ